jgi:hypothetical protein
MEAPGALAGTWAGMSPVWPTKGDDWAGLETGKLSQRSVPGQIMYLSIQPLSRKIIIAKRKLLSKRLLREI